MDARERKLLDAAKDIIAMTRRDRDHPERKRIIGEWIDLGGITAAQFIERLYLRLDAAVAAYATDNPQVEHEQQLARRVAEDGGRMSIEASGAEA